jgi:hypothetical protein
MIASAALLYDAVSKHHAFMGALNMGLCRGGNLLLGVSAVPTLLPDRGWLALLPILYIAAITLISRGEVNGGQRSTGYLALGLLAIVGSSLIGLNVWISCTQLAISDGSVPHWVAVLPLILVWGGLVLPAFIKAARDPQADLIRAAVRAGIIALIALDSAIAASFSPFIDGLAILSLLPISRLLAKQFAVT